VARHIFQACPVWIHTQSNITNIMKLECYKRRRGRLFCEATSRASFNSLVNFDAA
jgi:hypothetical protein